MRAAVGESDADARPEPELVAADLDRSRHRCEQPLGDGGGLGRLGNAREQDRELVAAEPRDGVAGTDERLDAAAELGENVVADAVAVLVVDRLELVEVEVDERRLGALRLADGYRVLELLVEEGTVRKAGERVEERLLPQLLLRLALGGDVEDDDALVADPDDAAVAGREPVLEAQRLMSAMRARVGGEDALPVVRVQRADEQVAVVLPLLDRVAQQRLDLRAREDVRARLVEGVDVDDERELLNERSVAPLDLAGIRRRLVRSRGRSAAVHSAWIGS